VAFLVKKKGGSIPAELGNPVVFTKDYVKHRLLSKTTYEQGTSGLVTKVMRVFSVESPTLTSAYQMVCSYVKCPSITSRLSLANLSLCSHLASLRARSKLGVLTGDAFHKHPRQSIR
jgi:hypothetical protein